MPSPAALRILFIGNSFTARHDLPALVAQRAAAGGTRLEHALISASGAPLRLHWNKGAAQQTIATGGYDAVVLQEQSTLPVKNPTRFHENVRLFDDVIRAAGARTLLFMTWARRHEPQHQALLIAAYDAIGAELGATVVPAGLAWERCLASHPELSLHDQDGSHPTLAGSYLAACVFCRVLLGNVAGGTVDGLSAADEQRLREVACAVVDADSVGCLPRSPEPD